ncbi:uncharacterized protein LOC128956464 [Oppia nitens]|uniref:uncharacterized protein LOC128956464 n=1 Tax=Oppia nitens TaxID=1686743 RepID=UPI0023DA8243|nr:uncharacterized protein LOC128956464 [Oppia nitens]
MGQPPGFVSPTTTTTTTTTMMANGQQQKTVGADTSTKIIYVERNDPPKFSRTGQVRIMENYEQCQQTKGTLAPEVKHVLRAFYIGRSNATCDLFYVDGHRRQQLFSLILADNNQVVSSIVDFSFVQQIKGNEHHWHSYGTVVRGAFTGAQVYRLKVYDDLQMRTDCSREPGLRRANVTAGQLQFNLPDGNGFVCRGRQQPGYNAYEPGFLFSQVHREARQRPNVQLVINSK